MGLLDEAIREHLELKRRRGADPSAIAHEEREALAPVLPEGLDSVSAGEGTADDELAAAEPAGTEALSAQERDEVYVLDDLAPQGQETAELDMLAVMEEDASEAGVAPTGPVAGGQTPVYAGAAGAADSLKWELPDEWEQEPAPEDIPGQERLSFE